MECAYPKDVGFTIGVKDYVGSGFLNTLGSWPTGIPSIGAKEDLLACMIARVNPSGTPIDIGFSGPSVPEAIDVTATFDFTEAVWTVDASSVSGPPTYHVWPSPALAALCEESLVGALDYRICGMTPYTCDMVQETGFDTRCTGDKGMYTCDGKPAIQTWLRTEDVHKLYPRCFEPR